MIGLEPSHLVWRKSSRSTGSEGSSCVEVAPVPPKRMIATRDSKDPHGPALCFTPAEWTGFLTRIRHGSHDL